MNSDAVPPAVTRPRLELIARLTVELGPAIAAVQQPAQTAEREQ